jgi:hypothetical protein
MTPGTCDRETRDSDFNPRLPMATGRNDFLLKA